VTLPRSGLVILGMFSPLGVKVSEDKMKHSIINQFNMVRNSIRRHGGWHGDDSLQLKMSQIFQTSLLIGLTPKISSDQIWIVGYFGQPLTYPYFIILSSKFSVTP
jgi:hypothetical protein